MDNARAIKEKAEAEEYTLRLGLLWDDQLAGVLPAKSMFICELIVSVTS